MLINLPINSDLSEKIIYNNPNIPYYIRHGLLSVYANYSAVSHWHDELEFIVILKGSMSYDVNGKTIELTKGQGIFVNSQNFHYGFSKEKKECEFMVILLHPTLISTNPYIEENILQPFFKNRNLSYLKLTQSIDWQNEILMLLTEMYNSSQNTPESPLTVISCFTRIIKILIDNFDNYQKKETASSDFKSLLKMVGFIQQRYGEKIRLENIADAGSCCKTKCSEIFKKYLHQSPGSYLIEYRLEKSIDRLLAGDMNVTEIAVDVGFSNSSHYCEAFRMHYNMTPKQYQVRMSNL